MKATNNYISSSTSTSTTMYRISHQTVPLNDTALSCSCASTKNFGDRENIFDRVNAMRTQEEAYRISNYFEFARSNPPPPSAVLSDITNFIFSAKNYKRGCIEPTNAACRSMMALWCYQVVDYCNLHRETVEIALSILDRFLCLASAPQDRQDDAREAPDPIAAQCLADRRLFQLAAMTSLYTAIKTCEMEVMDPSIVASLSRNMCTESEVIEMEATILMALGWRITAPTCHTAIDHLVQLLDHDLPQHIKRIVLEKARYYVELAVVEHDFMTLRPTLIAYAAIFNALEYVNEYDLSAQDKYKFLSEMSAAVGLDTNASSNDMVSTISDLRERLTALVTKQQTPKARDGMIKTPSGLGGSCSNHVKRRESTDGASPRCIGTTGTSTAVQ